MGIHEWGGICWFGSHCIISNPSSPLSGKTPFKIFHFHNFSTINILEALHNFLYLWNEKRLKKKTIETNCHRWLRQFGIKFSSTLTNSKSWRMCWRNFKKSSNNFWIFLKLWLYNYWLNCFHICASKNLKNPIQSLIILFVCWKMQLGSLICF